ncbi:MAG: MazG nucleotide pyrophosphohydrolase domain-containing protein [Halothiobacillus sp.]
MISDAFPGMLRADSIVLAQKSDVFVDAGSGGNSASVLVGVSSDLPAFERALQLQDAAARVGFDWPELADIWAKVYEELDELAAALANQDRANTFEELGDVLFAVTNLARRLELDPAAALEATNQKFIARFQEMERAAARDGVQLVDEPIDQQIARYQVARQALGKGG